MKLGLQIHRFDWPGGSEGTGSTLAEIGRACDRAGFDDIWVMDHFFQLEKIIGQARDPMLEAYTALGYLAGVTKKVELGTLVTGVIYRNPALLVKAVTTLDVLSGGRAWLGMGAAWYEREASGLGFPFPPLKERFERLEETIQIAKHMWSGDTSPFKGKHYRLEEPINSPQPLSEPHPPILIGGGGERKTLRLVAEYADACNFFMVGDNNRLKHKLKVLRGHCKDVGRPYGEIEKIALRMGEVSPRGAGELVDIGASLADIGIEHLILGLSNVHELSAIEAIGEEAIPELAEL